MAVLVYSAVHVAPFASDLDIVLVDEPAATDCMPTRPRSINQQRREALHPSVDGDVIDLDTALGQEFLDVEVGQAVSQMGACASSPPCRYAAAVGGGQWSVWPVW